MKRIESMLLRITLSILCIITLNVGATQPEEHKGKGLKPLSFDQQNYIQNNWPTVVDVNPNKLGQIRIEKHLKSIGEDLSILKDLSKSISEGEFITIKGFRKGIEKFPVKAIPLPSAVNNSTLPSFPPIGDQGQIGSCVAWGSTYYQASHEYGLLNGLNNKTSFTTVFSPKWTYNLLNNGVDDGLYILDAHDLLSKNGTVSILDFPYDTNYLAWDLDPQDWIDALFRRTAPAQLLSISTPEDIEVIKKTLNNGHVLNIGTYIDSWVFTKIKADPSVQSNPHAGEFAASWMNGYNGGHLMTIVGYDDNVWIDINGNGKVDSGEKGAFLIANSWSTDWGNKGFIWIAYDAFYPKSAVIGGPKMGRVPAADSLDSNLVLAVPKAPNYSPSLYAQFSLTQSYRNQIAISAGISDLTRTSPTKIVNSALAYQGGPYKFDGTLPNSVQTAQFAVDFTDLLPPEGTTQRYYIVLGDNKTKNPTTLNAFTIFDKIHSQQISASGVPVICDGTTKLPYVDYSFNSVAPDVNPPVVSITSPDADSTIQGSIEVHVNATDDVAVNRVEYYIDSKLHSTDLIPPYIFSVDTTKLANGSHQFTAIAYDTANNAAQDAINVNVQNPEYPAAIYVNAGGSDVSYNNVSWRADFGYTQSSTYSSTKSFANPVYQTGRMGRFSYNFDVANGNHTVTLKFAETQTAKSKKRVFNVVINGKRVTSNLDLIKTKGFGLPYDLNFPVSVTNNKIRIDFVPINGDAIVSGIQIIKS